MVIFKFNGINVYGLLGAPLGVIGEEPIVTKLPIFGKTVQLDNALVL